MLAAGAALAYVNRRYFLKKARDYGRRHKRGYYKAVAAASATLAPKLMANHKTLKSWFKARGPRRSSSHSRRSRSLSPMGLRKRGRSMSRSRSVRRSRGPNRYAKTPIYRGLIANKRKVVKRYGYNSVGTYSKFKTANKGWKSAPVERYCKNGVFGVQETTGSTTDADCVYVLAESIEHLSAFRYIVMGCLRKLFNKGGIPVKAIDVPLIDPFNQGINELDYVVILSGKNMVTGAVNDFAHAIVAADTLWSIAATFVTPFITYSAGYGRDDVNNAIDYAFMTFKKSSESDDVVLSQIALDEIEVELYGSCQMKVQNRSKSATGSSDAEDINNNPLQGRTYVFNGLPKAKDSTWASSTPSTWGFEWIPTENFTGVRPFGAGTAGVGLSSSFKEPPTPGTFWNTALSSKVVLDPGSIKSFGTSTTKKKPLKLLLRQMRYTTINKTPFGQLDALNTSMFKSVMVALEDVINVNSQELIAIAYECERKIGVICTEKKKKYCRQYFFQNTA